MNALGQIVCATLVIWAAVISAYDWKQWKVPNAALILVFVPAALSLIVQGRGLLGEARLSSVLGLLLAFALTFPGYALKRFGAGDVKFAAVLGLLLGWRRGFEMVLLASMLLGATALVLLKMKLPRQSKFPAAPMLSAAFVAEMLGGPWLDFNVG